MDDILARDVLEDLVRRYDGALKRFLGARVAREDVHDIAHEAYLRVLQASRAGDIRHPRAFLFRTAGNVAVDHARRQRHVQPADDAAPAATEADSVERPEQRLGAQRLECALRAALEELPDACSRAFCLRRFHGASSSEIAIVLGVSTRMVNKYIASAIAHVARRIEPLLETERP